MPKNDFPTITEAKVDTNIQSTDYEHIISDEGAEWTVEPSYQSTVPKIESEIEESFIEESIFEEPVIEEPILQEPELHKSVDLVESTPIFQQ